MAQTELEVPNWAIRQLNVKSIDCCCSRSLSGLGSEWSVRSWEQGGGRVGGSFLLVLFVRRLSDYSSSGSGVF